VSPIGTLAAIWRTRLRPYWRQLPLAVQLASAALALMVVAFWCLSAFLDRQDAAHDAAEGAVDRLHRIEVAVNGLALGMVNMETGKRGFSLMGDTAFLEPFLLGRRQVAAFSDSLERLEIRRDTALGRGVDEVLASIAAWRTASAEPDIEARLRGTLPADLAAQRVRAARGKVLMDEARAAQEALVRRVVALAAETRTHEREHDAVRRRDAFLARTALAGAVLLVLVVWMRIVTRTLRRIVRSADAVAEGDYARVDLDADEGGSGELARLAAVFDRLALAVAEREQILRSDILQLRELEQLKSAFVSTVSHELRTPLTSVRGALGLVLGGAAGETSPKTRDLLRIAHQNTERLIRLINEILDIEKLESGHIQLRREPCDLAGIARTTIAALDAYASEHGVSVELEPVAGPVMLHADADRLVQVATNLVSNAVKFSPSGSVVRVGVAADGPVARLTVADRGPGIPVEFQSRIFGRFQQADHSGSRAYGGTGLGLAIVRSITELHGGTVRFETSPGAGTTFIVELPCDVASPATAPAESRGDRILIVDADAGMRSVLEALCAPLGEVVGVATPEEGWRVAAEGRVDAVVADPAGQANVLDLLRRLRALTRLEGAPILVFSAEELAPESLEGIVLAPTHVFVKTRDRETDLVMRLRAALLARGARYQSPLVPAPAAAH
jgi:signal transduction histidine kinase